MSNKIFKNKAYLILLLVACIGIGLSLIAFFYVNKWENSRIVDEKKEENNNNVRILRQTVTTFGNTLNAISGLANVHYPITQKNFSKFVKGEMLNQPGMRALGWIGVVSNSERLTVINQLQKLKNSNYFDFWEFSIGGNRRIAKQRDVYYPILFAEPNIINYETLGYDLASNPILKQALDVAIETKSLTASGAIWIHTAQGKKLALLLLLPCYQLFNNEQNKKLIGFAVGTFLLKELVVQTLRISNYRTETFMVMFDDTPQTQTHILYAPPWYNKREYSDNNRLSMPTPFEFGGRALRIEFYNSKNDSLKIIWLPWIVVFMGLFVTLGLWRYMYMVLNHTHSTELLVSKRTLSLLKSNQALNKEINTREKISQELKNSKQRFQAIFNEAAIGIVQTTLDDKILDSNRALQSLLRYREDELNNRFLKSFAHPNDTNIDATMLKKVILGEYDTYRVNKRYICKNGTIIWTNQSCSIVQDVNNPFLINMIEDITERRLSEQARLEAEKKYRDIFENAIEGIFQCDSKGKYLNINPAFVNILGYQSDNEIRAEITDIGEQIYVNSDRWFEFLELLKTNSQIENFEYQAYRKDGSIIWLNETIRIVHDTTGNMQYYEGIVEDITDKKKIEEKLQYDATHDQLTGLWNRVVFTEYLNKFIEDNKNFAVFFIDLDEFKIVNDLMGHLAGDELLKEIANRLEFSIGEQDIVARFGGDEFAILLENPPETRLLNQFAKHIQKQVNQPYQIKTEIFTPSASIGIALNDMQYASADNILRDADTAMYEAKREGRKKSLIFDPEMRTRMISKFEMESDLRKAIEREEFCVYYQPIISLKTRKIVSLEALVRWLHPKRGLVGPDSFIPLAEETGLIRELGLWVFETACNQLYRWQKRFPHHSNLGMNINVSPIQMKQAILVEQIKNIINRTGIKGPTCRIEITETAMMQDPEAAMLMLNDLKSLDVLLYIDDFGTGYSSISYLQKFPIDALKIDKSFIQPIGDSPKAAQIVNAIISLGEACSLKVVAEGVEESEQIKLLKTAHCHHVQGYFFSPPKDSETIEKLLISDTYSL
ncbi:MAG: EAL domain-containing protein [Thiomargarita sp.]|nr:EAL domain-containing protein [Thiomargarita sp.]